MILSAKTIFLFALAIFPILPHVAHGTELIGQTPLPAPVPYLNTRENFFMGNGYAGGGGPGDGSWNFLTGPDYTCPNYLKDEELSLVVDDTEKPLTMEVYRARKTGIFYGTKTLGDLKVYLIDYAPMDKPWVARMVRVENMSRSAAHTISVNASIVPISGPGRSREVEFYKNNQVHWINFKLDTSMKCVQGHFCTNWADRFVTITFDKPTPTIAATNGGYLLGTQPETLAPRASSDTVLYHYTHYADISDEDCVRQIQPRNASQDLADCINWWQRWFDGVAPQYSLNRIKDQRARDLVEGGLAILKMNQCRNSGIVANERGWNMSYVRDGYCGLRGLTAFGHFDESKCFLQWLDHQYAVHHLIPDAGPGGSDIYAHPNGNNGRTCPEANAVVEVTALEILAARDYYRGTHDLPTLDQIDTSLRYCMDAQLKYAMTNDYRLEFSGDETELCGASDVEGLRAEGYNRKLNQYWSMTSIALCAASLDFYIQYLKANENSHPESLGQIPSSHREPTDDNSPSPGGLSGRSQAKTEEGRGENPPKNSRIEPLNQVSSRPALQAIGGPFSLSQRACRVVAGRRPKRAGVRESLPDQHPLPVHGEVRVTNSSLVTRHSSLSDAPANYLNHQNHQTLNLYVQLANLQNALERDYWRTNVPECPGGFYDWFRIKSDGAWPSGRLINFTLFPIYYSTPLKYPAHAKLDVEAMKPFFHPQTPLLTVIGVPGRKSLGHDLGYLLWSLCAVDDPEKKAVYKALVNGPTAGCWGTYHEAYAGDGTPNANGLRTFETGVDLSAIAKYWNVGE